jgi:hypothetical protein
MKLFGTDVHGSQRRYAEVRRELGYDDQVDRQERYPNEHYGGEPYRGPERNGRDDRRLWFASEGGPRAR